MWACSIFVNDLFRVSGGRFMWAWHDFPTLSPHAHDSDSTELHKGERAPSEEKNASCFFLKTFCILEAA